MTRLSVMRTTFTNKKKIHWILMAACPTKGRTSLCRCVLRRPQGLAAGRRPLQEAYDPSQAVILNHPAVTPGFSLGIAQLSNRESPESAWIRDRSKVSLPWSVKIPSMNN